MNLINNKYNLLEQIGLGTFGSIFKAENVRTRELVAIKVESILSETKLLKNESIIYQYLKDIDGVPNIKWFGKDNYNYYMVINLLGPSLLSIRENKGNFSLKLTLEIGIKTILLLKIIHDRGLIHRDIKPDNFLLGINNNNINIIDFGFCKTYVNNNQHILFGKTSSLIGSLNYASINAHNFYQLSRRDDLESLGYMLIYLYLGTLDWQETNVKVTEINNHIKQQKYKLIKNTLIPRIFTNYLNNIRNLTFEEKPNYDYLINNFKREIDILVQK
jgi:casein kinase I family protein HRR25